MTLTIRFVSGGAPNFKSLSADLVVILLGVSSETTKDSKRTSWFLTGVNADFYNRTHPWGSTGISVPNFKSLAADLVVILLSVSRASSKESRRTVLIPDWSQG